MAGRHAVRVVPTRPGPFVQGAQTVGIDADDDDVAHARVSERGRTRFGNGVLHTSEPARLMQVQTAGENGQDGRRQRGVRPAGPTGGRSCS